MEDGNAEDLATKITQLEQLVKPHLTKEALSRYGNVRVAHPQLCVQVLITLAQRVQKTQQTIDDRTLKLVLLQLQQRQSNIQFR